MTFTSNTPLLWLPYALGALIVAVGTYASWHDPIGMWIIGAAAGIWLSALIVLQKGRKRSLGTYVAHTFCTDGTLAPCEVCVGSCGIEEAEEQSPASRQS